MAHLLFITSTRIGDAVLSTAALEHGRALAGAERVTIACGALAAPLFRATPGLDSVHVIRKQKRDGHWHALWRELRAAGHAYDLAIDVRGSLLSFFLPVERRIIFRQRRGLHKLDELGAMFAPGVRVAPKVHLDARAGMEASAVSGDGAPLLVLALGASALGKMWPGERYEALACALLEGPLRGGRVVCVGGPDDAQRNAPLIAALRAGGFDAIDAAGKLDLLASAALMRRAALYVGNDSGPTHLAAAVGAATLALFGPSDERIYGPRGPRTRALRGKKSYEDILREGGDREDHARTWMTDLTADAAIAAARELLETR
ncbi:MAG: glycosyltransferase family 9 protein [Hyphomonadaceae bacterium]